MPDIGFNIRKIRELRGFTQEFVAEKLEIHTKTYRKLETGKRSPTNAQLELLSSLFDYKIEQIRLFNLETLHPASSATPARSREGLLEQIVVHQNDRIDTLLGQVEKLHDMVKSLLYQQEKTL